jgi:ribonucleoside-diphosphate reductase alpha chain
MLGLHYDSDRARDQAAAIAEHLRNAAYAESVELAREKGCFALFQRDAFLAGAFVSRLPAVLREGIARHGLRNGQLLAIAPAGSISLLANNVSSGIEPVFAFEGARRVRTAQGWEQHESIDQAWRHWRERFGAAAKPGDAFVTARNLSPAAHLAMQAAMQAFVDGAISKTINLPEDYPKEGVGEIFKTAYRLRLKGCTVFAPNARTGAVLLGGGEAQAADARSCCVGS